MKIRQNFALIAALAVPVVMIGLVALSIYLPRAWANPKNDFIYTTEYNYFYRFSVINGKLVPDQTPDPNAPVPMAPPGAPATTPLKGPVPNPIPKIFLHHTATDTNEEITLQQAENLNLSGDLRSPDGYEIERGDSGPFFFGGNNYNSFYITGHHSSKKINLNTSNYNNDFHLIGWVLK